MAGLILSRSAVNEALQGRQDVTRVERTAEREEREEERRGSYRRFGRGVARAEAAGGAAQNETCNKVSF